jgi:septum formation protein
LLNLSSYQVILASRSPRRNELLKGLGVDFKVMLKETPEDFDPVLSGSEVASLLSKRKSEAFEDCDLPENYLLITADTIVWLNGKILNKPADQEEAFAMLAELSGNHHTVYTGVYLRSKHKTVHFCESSEVYFSQLTPEEIWFYIHNYKPFDKAGAYGIQEWIGYVGINHIEGSYFNVMGLPTQRLYSELCGF